MTQIRVPVTGVPGPPGPPGDPGSGGVPSTGGTFTGPVKIHRQVAPSNRATNTPAFYTADTSGASFRSFQIFADENLMQIGRTPEPAQWPVSSNGFSAPAGSAGPRALPSVGAGGFIFSENDAHFHMFANMAPLGGGAADGVNEQADIGLVGANSLGKMRGVRVALGSDGGFRVEGNRVQLPTVAGVGTITAAAGVLTVSVADSIKIGQAVYVIDDLGNRNGVTVMSRTDATHFVGNDTDSYSARAFEIEEGQQLDTNRGSGKFGFDSMGTFGIGLGVPLDATGHPYPSSDFDIYFYTRGWNQLWNGTSPDRADIAVKRKGQSLAIVTGRADINNAMRTSVVFQPWYDFGDGTAGNVEFYGQIRAQGGNAGSRAAFFMKPQTADPDPSQLQDGDEWVNSSDWTWRKRLNGVTYKVNLTAV